MTKKDLLLKVLEKLHDTRDLAEGFLVVVQQSDNQEILEELWGLVYAGIKTISDKNKKEFIKEQLIQIKSLRLTEEESSSKDQRDADRILDSLLNDIG